MYRIFVKAPSHNVRIGSQVRSVAAGDTLYLTNEEGDQLLASSFGRQCVVVERTEDVVLQKEPLTSESQPQDNLYSGSIPYSDSIPTRLPDIKDPLDQEYQKAAAETQSLMLGHTPTKDSEEQQIQEVEKELQKESPVAPIDYLELVQTMDSSTVWTSVYKVLMQIKGAEPIDYYAVQALKDKYPSYKKVTEECDRILANTIHAAGLKEETAE
jgi:hypothetical protein